MDYVYYMFNAGPLIYHSDRVSPVLLFLFGTICLNLLLTIHCCSVLFGTIRYYVLLLFGTIWYY